MNDAAFTGSIPAIYDRYLVPLLFAQYAAHLAGRVGALHPHRVLETAAGTGIVTRELVRALPAAASITATDINQAMLEIAVDRRDADNVTWLACDAAKLPFADGEFDAVACQFGVMFFPDRTRAYEETLRVLRPGGAFVFVVWDTLDSNEISAVVAQAIADRYPDDPPVFMQRTPFGYHDADEITLQLREAGFGRVEIETVSLPTMAASPREPAVGLCQGTPMRGEILAREPDGLEEATDAAEAALAARFGEGPLESRLRALVVTAFR